MYCTCRYPTPSQYKFVCSTLVTKFPVLKDRAQNSSGYDTWKESLINKFKYERSPMQSNDVLKKREVYGHKKAAVDRNQPPSIRAKRDSVETNQPGEDAVSMHQDTLVLQQLAAERNPDMALVKDKMEKTRRYRMDFIAQHSVKEILEEFPILKNETQLLAELQAAYGGKDVHAFLCKFFLEAADGIMALARKNSNCSDILQSYTALHEECTSEKQKQDLTVDACSLLLPLLLGEKDLMYVINKEPVVPTPCLIIQGNNPLDTNDLHISMDGEVLASCSSISMGFAATFASFYVYAAQYPLSGKNTPLLYQHQFAGLGNNKALSPKVLRFLNNLHKVDL
ncbi:sterile alpha motif domain-containing protein 3-like [Diadema setosum]|uniref:sterile alpha motif domain-containing protein 3-like n=1 Tax=Diadema setosum TaxID=31175 RepID=UPI003B3BB4FB